MPLLKFIPNLLTLLNLLCGVLATVLAAQNQLLLAVYFILLGIFFDFFDGFFARLLKVSGELGKQLDSLADVVTSGVAPAVILLQLLNSNSLDTVDAIYLGVYSPYSFLGLIFSAAAAYRLAKFNLDNKQTKAFIGLPTPAATIVVISLPLILKFGHNTFINNLIVNKWFLIVLTFILSYLMHANIKLIALKFKDFSFAKNKVKYIFLLISILLLFILKVIAIPLIIVVYVGFSMLCNLITKKN